jgi:hypothetical protein
MKYRHREASGSDESARRCKKLRIVIYEMHGPYCAHHLPYHPGFGLRSLLYFQTLKQPTDGPMLVRGSPVGKPGVLRRIPVDTSRSRATHLRGALHQRVIRTARA